jgi:hypothetical protein
MEMVRRKMTIRVLLRLLTVVISSLFMAGCHRGPSATAVYGRASNADRKARGLPIIPPTWIERPCGDQADWNNPDHANVRTARNPMHTYKDLFLDEDGNPRCENDEYQSGKRYHQFATEPGDLSPETMTITYDFRAAREGKNPWSCQVNCGPHDTTPPSAPTLTLEDAEAILKEWGLKRLNY